MLTYDLTEKNKYYSLYARIRDDVICGNLKCGEKLPSKRSLAQNLSVSVITVQTAYDQLLAEGYITSKERSGYFVADINVDYYGSKNAMQKNADTPLQTTPLKTTPLQTTPLQNEQNNTEEKMEREYKLDFVSGSTPAQLFPFSVWAKLMRATLSEEGEHLLERVPCDGDGNLKKAIADYLYRCRGVKVDAKYIVIGAGAEYLYGLIVQLLGRDKLYAVENPGYGRISSTYNLYGAQCLYIDVTKNGVDVGEVENSCADVLHISPSHQFPTGAVMTAGARSRLIKWATERDAYIIEDDYDSEFRLYGKPLQCMLGLNGDRVIYLNTFSKSLAPSMRMGYMVLPPALYKRYMQMFYKRANVVPLFEQKALALMISGGYFERHINRLKNYYRDVRDILLKKLSALSFPAQIIETGSGLHLTVKFPSAKNDEQIIEEAAKRGIKIRCLSHYLLSPFSGCEKIAVINYSGLTKEALISFNFE